MRQVASQAPQAFYEMCCAWDEGKGEGELKGEGVGVGEGEGAGGRKEGASEQL